CTFSVCPRMRLIPLLPLITKSRGGAGRVEDARDGVQDRRRLLRAASFVAALAEKSIAPSRVPAHRTGRDHFGHPALGRVSRTACAGGELRKSVQSQDAQLPKYGCLGELPIPRPGHLVPSSKKAAHRMIQMPLHI